MATIRDLLRKARRAFGKPDERETLRAEGIVVGEAIRITPEQLMADLEAVEDDDRPYVLVTIAVKPGESARRDELEDLLTEYVESSGIGSWSGGGDGSAGDQEFFDVSFTVENVKEAAAAIWNKLAELGVQDDATISASDGTTFGQRRL